VGAPGEDDAGALLPSAEERLAVLRAAHQQRRPGWVDAALEALLFDEDARVRSEAIAAMEHVAAAEALPHLVEGLRASLRYVRRRAAQALARLPLELVLPRLQAALLTTGSGDRLARESADLLGRLGDRRALPALLQALDHADAVVRLRAVCSLGALLESPAGSPRPPAIPAETAARQARAGRVTAAGEELAAAAAHALGQLGRREAIPALLGGLERPGPVAAAAVAALARLGPGLVPAAGEAGAVWLADSDPGAGQLLRPGVAAARLVEQLGREQDPRAAGRLARALLSLGEGGRQALGELVAASPSVSEAGLGAAARALLAGGREDGPWERLATHPAARCRVLAARGLARQGHPAARATLAGLTGDPEPTVAWVAAEGLRAERAWASWQARCQAPHPRLELPSAQPPYGLPLPAVPPSPPVGPARVALAAVNLAMSTNLGVLLRSAEAAGVGEVFIGGDPRYHPGAARGADRHVLLSWLREPAELLDLADSRGYGLVAVQQSPAASRYDLASYPPHPLFVLGAEAAGLPRELLLACDQVVEIPIVGQIDSLNVATAGTIVLFDWLRRQGFPGT